jgi:hypothetical protein
MFEILEHNMTHYVNDKHLGDLFAQYVNMFVILKQVSSGYPSRVQSEDDKDRYIKDYWLPKGIALDKVSIFKNSGKRTLEKLKLNSMWGKWTENLKKIQTSLIK